MNFLNGRRYVRDALESAFAQHVSDWEVIFLDNASHDGSGDIAASYGPKVRVFRGRETVSLGAARNLALAQCRGAYIAILDIDDIWLPEKLDRQLPLLEDNPQVALAYSNCIFFDDTGDRRRLFDRCRPYRGQVFGALLADNFVSTETMIYRKQAIDKLPYAFDDRFTMVMDYDLSLRIAYHYHLDYVDEPLSKWRMHAGSESNRKRFLIPKENKLMIDKLAEELPDIRSRHMNQIEILLRNISGQLALEQWYLGNRDAARSLLKPYVGRPRYLVTYGLSYLLPFQHFDRFQSTIGRVLRRLARRRVN